jgi:Txe/YoeB family toxin of Txe-Axe toxin-antitoxin module
MKSITINISNDKLAKKILELLSDFKKEGLEIVAKEDLEDLKLLKATREEESLPFEDYLKNEYSNS